MDVRIIERISNKEWSRESLMNKGFLVEEEGKIKFQGLKGFKFNFEGNWDGVGVEFDDCEGNSIIIHGTKGLSIYFSNYMAFKKYAFIQHTFIKVKNSKGVYIKGDLYDDALPGYDYRNINIDIEESEYVTVYEMAIDSITVRRHTLSKRIELEKVNARYAYIYKLSTHIDDSIFYLTDVNSLGHMRNSKIIKLSANYSVIKRIMTMGARSVVIDEIRLDDLPTDYSDYDNPLYSVRINGFGTYDGVVILFPNFNLVFAGCWSGTLEEFEDKMEEVLSRYPDDKRIQSNRGVIDYFKGIRKTSAYLVNEVELRYFKDIDLKKVNGVKLDYDYFHRKLNEVKGDE